MVMGDQSLKNARQKAGEKEVLCTGAPNPHPLPKGSRACLFICKCFWKEVSFTGGAGLFVAGLLLRNL